MISNLKITALSIGSFPFGEAHVNRQLSYLRGLSEKNIETKVFVLYPSNKQSKKSNKTRLRYYKLKIQYCSLLLYPKSKLLKYANIIIGIIIGLIKIIKEKDKSKKNILMLLFVPSSLLSFYIFWGKLLHYKIVHERTEDPNIIGTKYNVDFYLKKLIPRLDGLFVITHSLKDFFSKYTNKNILVLPMSVESDRFITVKKESVLERYIAYCGSMYTEKDGVPDLIKAFNIVAKEVSDIRLYLIGDNSDRKAFSTINKTINQSKFKDRIVCTGYIERDVLPRIIKNASILALARPKNDQARGGFPTKLGEYLSTGNPVVITDVGEHALYLKNNESAILTRPNDPIAFAKGILKLLYNPVKAKHIGLEGQKIAFKYFDYKTQTKAIINYLTNL